MSTETDLSTIVPVILAGGRGKRLWPLSTPARPKPFLRLGSGGTLLQQTADRVKSLAPPFVICNADHRELVSTQISAAQIFLEPAGRGTAPAVAVAAHYLAQGNGDTLMLVMPSDHAIDPPEALMAALSSGCEAARSGRLVTFGITPRSPSPHFGYIRTAANQDSGVLPISAFVEKPDRKTAKAYLESGEYFWNSGIFLFTARAYLEALHAQQPDIHATSYKSLATATRLRNAVFLNKDAFSACPALSIDYAVMEKTKNGTVMPVATDWHDLGTWPSLCLWLLKSK